MPVVLITGPPLASAEETQRMLASVNKAVAAALDLRPADVYSACSSTSAAMLGESAVEPWPVAVLYGTGRPAERMAAALSNVREALVSAWRCAPETVWAQWVVSS